MDGEELAIWSLPIGVIAVLVCFVLWADSRGCHSKWAHSGFITSWGPIQGCLISKDGRVFIPEDNYRQFEDSKP